jgi:predicted dehydrogenase
LQKEIPMKDDRRRIAVVGVGRWGPHHVRVFSSLPSSQVTALVDTDQARLEQSGQLVPLAKRFLSLEDLLASDTPVDVVVIATPACTHCDLVSLALRAGKHVLCEKPLCPTSDECRQLCALAKERGLVLMVGFVFLFNQGILRLKEIVDAGELGEIRYISATRTNLGPIRDDVGACLDLATHDISICNHLVGSMPVRVSATGGSFLSQYEDVAFLTLTYPRNILVNIEVSWLNPRKVRRTTVVGSKRMAVWDDLAPASPISIYDVAVKEVETAPNHGQFRLHVSWGNLTIPYLQQREPLMEQAKYFLECIGVGKVKRGNDLFGVGVTEVAEAALASMRMLGQPVIVNDNKSIVGKLAGQLGHIALWASAITANGMDAVPDFLQQAIG